MAGRSRGLPRLRDDLSRLRGSLRVPFGRSGAGDDPYWDSFINRPPVVRALKWIDYKVWGEFPKRRVRFMGYDTGLKVGEHNCTIPECTANHKEPKKLIEGNVGFYAPVKKQTDNFVKRG